MALHTLDPDTFTEEERTALREQVKKLLTLVRQHSEDSSATGRAWEKTAEASFLPEENLPTEHLSAEDLSEKNHSKEDPQPASLKEEEGPASRLNVRVGKEEIGLPLPRSLAVAFFEVLTEVAQGHSVSVGVGEEELTTSEAAELLGVSRPHLVKLLEEGEIPFRKVGTHRRVRREDVLEYKQRQRKEAEEAMQNLADQAQELGLGY